MAFWRAQDGTIIVDGTGKPINCATCPCEGAVECPSDCSGCSASYGATVAGLTGDCCSMGNGEYTITQDEIDNCTWDGSATDGWSYVASVEVACVNGAWTVTYTLDSRVYPCTAGPDVWVGTIAAADCPAGEYTLTHTIGDNCSGDITVTIAELVGSTTSG